jgi:hypothetical protein
MDMVNGDSGERLENGAGGPNLVLPDMQVP